MKKLRMILDRYWLVVAILAGVVAYAVTMLLSIGQSIWFDEGYSILLARSSYQELLALTAVDAHPPLYYLMLKIWGEMFGFSEGVLRSLSAIFLGATVMLATLLTKRLFGLRAGIVAIGVLLLAPFLLRYGYEIRMYALATLIGVVATYALVCAQQTKRLVWWICYAVLVALGMYTLYMMAAVWLAHVVWLVWSSLRSKTPVVRWRWPLAFVGSVLLFAPYLPTFLHQFTNSVLPGIGTEVTLPVIADVMSVLAVFTPGWLLGGWLTLLIIAAGVFVSVWGVRVFRTLQGEARSWFILYGCLAVVPLLFFALISLPPREPIFTVRYMAHVAVWLYLLVAVIAAYAWRLAPKRIAIAGGVLLLALGGIGVATLADRGNMIFERAQTPMTHELRADIGQCHDDTVIIADDPYTYIDARFYFDDCVMLFYAPGPVAKQGGYAPLADSVQRLSDAHDVSARTIVHLHWGEPTFHPDGRYRTIERRVYDKQHVDRYELIAE